MQPVKFTFMKKGLTPNEFQDCLTSKVNELFKDLHIPSIKTLMTNRVVEVRKAVCIRENRTKDSLDKRSSKGIRNLANNKLLSRRVPNRVLQSRHPDQNFSSIP